MSNLENEVFESVQAALLNSECRPQAAVIQALRASALFAQEELDASFEAWVQACRDAWEQSR